MSLPDPERRTSSRATPTSAPRATAERFVPARAELLAGLEARSPETQLGSAAFLAPTASAAERERLFAWLERVALADRGQRFTARAAERVGPLLGRDEAAWALDLYFRVAHASFAANLVHPFGLLGALDRLPEAPRLARFRRESASPSAAARRAAFEGARRLAGPARNELLLLFRGERHPAFCRRVRSLLELEGLVDGDAYWFNDGVRRR